MNTQLAVTLALLVAAVAMFALNRPRVDAVALLMMAALPLAGVISVPQALAGFADPNVVLIALMFVIGDSLCAPASPSVWATGWWRAPVQTRRGSSCS